MDKNVKALIEAMLDVRDGKHVDDVYASLEKKLNEVSVKVWREDNTIPLPTYGKNGDACCDVYCKSIDYDANNDRFIIHTGLHFALPDNYEMELRPRSSNTKTNLYIPNSPGTLDFGYRGELLIVFKTITDLNIYHSIDNIINAIDDIKIDNYHNDVARTHINNVDNKFHYKIGDRICQLLVRKREQIIWDEVKTLEELGDTERGIGGFGSTGK